MPDGVLLTIILPAHTDRYPFPIVGQIRQQADRVNEQAGRPVVEFICVLDNGSISTGDKLNMMYAMSQGAYIAGIGDDDTIAPDYVSSLVRAIKDSPGVDIVSFDHDYFVNGTFNAVTVVSKDFRDSQEEGLHHRRPTPKCAIRAEICRQFNCPSISDKEDQSMSEWLVGRLETEVRVGRVIYHHDWNRENKRWRQQQAKFWGRA